MQSDYGFDSIDGRAVPHRVVLEGTTLMGTHRGTVHVEAGHFNIAGTLQGTLDVHAGATVDITGTQQGSVRVASGAAVIVTGTLEGTAAVERGGTLVVEAAGVLSGTLTNDGRVLLRGALAGQQTGAGELRIEGGHIAPDRNRRRSDAYWL